MCRENTINGTTIEYGQHYAGSGTCGIINKQGEHSNEERILLATIKKIVTLVWSH